MLNLSINTICTNCGKTNKLFSDYLVKIDDDNPSGNIEHILQTYMEAGVKNLGTCCDFPANKHKITSNQYFIFILFKTPRNIDPFESCKFGEYIFQYSSHVEDKEEELSKYNAHFLYNELMLHQEHNEVSISDREKCFKSVKLLVLIKKKC